MEEPVVASKCDTLSVQKTNKQKKSKTAKKETKIEENEKTFLKIFQSLKAGYEMKDFKNLLNLQRDIRKKKFSSFVDFVKTVRKIFSEYFLYFSKDRLKYMKIFQIASTFEDLVREKEEKIFLKRSQALIKTNKKIKELKRTANKIKRETTKNQSSSTRFKISLSDMEITSASERKPQESLNEFRYSISKQIQRLSLEKKKELLNLVNKNYLRKDSNQCFNLEISKMPLRQLQKIENFLNGQSTKEEILLTPSVTRTASNIIINAPKTYDSTPSSIKEETLLRIKKDILEDDLSDSLSDDESNSSNESEC